MVFPLIIAAGFEGPVYPIHPRDAQVQGLPAFWPDNELVPLFTSSLGLLVLIRTFLAWAIVSAAIAPIAAADDEVNSLLTHCSVIAHHVDAANLNRTGRP